MTPPDRDGNQVHWIREYTSAGTLFLPENIGSTAIDLLVPGTYTKETTGDSCIGAGTLDFYVEAGVVHRHKNFAVKSAPFINRENLLDWLAANLMMRESILALADKEDDFIECDISGTSYKVKTPQYHGLLALDEQAGGKAVILMSDESIGGARTLDQVEFGEMDSYLLGTTMRAMEARYPHNSVKWDHYNENWLVRTQDKTLIRLDLFGTDSGKEYIRYTRT